MKLTENLTDAHEADREIAMAVLAGDNTELALRYARPFRYSKPSHKYTGTLRGDRVHLLFAAKTSEPGWQIGSVCGRDIQDAWMERLFYSPNEEVCTECSVAFARWRLVLRPVRSARMVPWRLIFGEQLP